jgi:hypothetical protein
MARWIGSSTPCGILRRAPASRMITPIASANVLRCQRRCLPGAWITGSVGLLLFAEASSGGVLRYDFSSRTNSHDDIALDRDGRLLIADRGSRRFRHVDSSGKIETGWDRIASTARSKSFAKRLTAEKRVARAPASEFRPAEFRRHVLWLQRDQSSQTKNGPPKSAVVTPTGISSGANALREIVSQTTRKAPPPNSDAGMSTR